MTHLEVAVVEAVRLVGSVLIVASAVLAVACVAAQFMLSRWWETAGGRHVFWFQVVLAGCLGLWAVRVAFPAGDWFDVARLLAFAGIPVVLAWRLKIIVWTWRHKRQERVKEER